MLFYKVYEYYGEKRLLLLVVFWNLLKKKHKYLLNEMSSTRITFNNGRKESVSFFAK